MTRTRTAARTAALGLAAGIAVTAVAGPSAAAGAVPSSGRVDTSIGAGVLGLDGSMPVEHRWTWGASVPALAEQGVQHYAELPNGDAFYRGTEALSAAQRVERTRLRPLAGVEFHAYGVPQGGGANVFTERDLADYRAVDQDAAAFTGAWAARSSSSAYRGGTRVSTTPGASASWTGTFSDLGVVAATGPGAGQVRVLVDGVDRGVVDLRRSTAQARTIVFRTSVPTGTHTVRLVDASTTAGATVALDGFAVVREH